MILRPIGLYISLLKERQDEAKRLMSSSSKYGNIFDKIINFGTLAIIGFTDFRFLEFLLISDFFDNFLGFAFPLPAFVSCFGSVLPVCRSSFVLGFFSFTFLSFCFSDYLC